jgi:hypothetical protein
VRQCDAHGGRETPVEHGARLAVDCPHGAGQIAHRHRIYRCSSDSAPNHRCGASIVDADKVETWVWAIVMDRLDHPEVLAAEKERQQEEGPDPC